MSSFDIVQFNGASTSYSTGRPYTSKPQWDGSGDPFPGISNRQGYDVVAAQFPESRRSAAYSQANGYLNDNSFQWPMFIHDVRIDMAISGNTGQSIKTRDFYPHNFIQPSFVIQGQALDQRDYGNLTAFIHRAQKQAIVNGKLMQLWIKGMGIDGSQNNTLGVVKNGQFFPNQIIRGKHQALLCQGYVASMPREHKVGDVSPMYSFQFIVADMMQGPFQEDMVQVAQQATWIDILKSTQTFKVDAALIKQNTAILKNIAAHSANILNTHGGSSSPGASGSTSNGNLPGSQATGTGTGNWQTVTATYFTDTTFSCGGQTNNGWTYAELNNGQDASSGLTNPALGPLFGFHGSSGLPCGFKLEIKNPATGKSGIFVKNDIGTGAPGAQIDLWVGGSNGIGFTNIGKGPLQIRAA